MRLRFFGRLRDTVGDTREVVVPAEVTDTEQLRAWLGRDHPELIGPNIRIALDDCLPTGRAPLGAVREVSFLPPVSGG